MTLLYQQPKYNRPSTRNGNAPYFNLEMSTKQGVEQPRYSFSLMFTLEYLNGSYFENGHANNLTSSPELCRVGLVFLLPGFPESSSSVSCRLRLVTLLVRVCAGDGPSSP